MALDVIPAITKQMFLDIGLALGDDVFEARGYSVDVAYDGGILRPRCHRCSRYAPFLNAVTFPPANICFASSNP